LLSRTAATTWREVYGLYVEERHLLQDPFDRVAALSVFKFFNLLFECFTLRQQGAVSSVCHFRRVFFYDWQCEFDQRCAQPFRKARGNRMITACRSGPFLLRTDRGMKRSVVDTRSKSNMSGHNPK
jgi:hypothetical protein